MLGGGDGRQYTSRPTQYESGIHGIVPEFVVPFVHFTDCCGEEGRSEGSSRIVSSSSSSASLGLFDDDSANANARQEAGPARKLRRRSDDDDRRRRGGGGHTNDAKRPIWHYPKESRVDVAQAAPTQLTKMGYHAIAQEEALCCFFPRAYCFYPILGFRKKKII